MVDRLATIKPYRELLMTEQPLACRRQRCRDIVETCVHSIESQGLEKISALILRLLSMVVASRSQNRRHSRQSPFVDG